MPEALPNALLYGSLAGLGSMLGAALVVKGEAWIRRFMPLVISFAAGTLLAVAFFDLLPEALEMLEEAHSQASLWPWVLGSFIAFYFLEQLLHYHSHHHVEHHHPMGLVAFMGMAFHSLIDGIVIGVGFAVSPALGIVTTMSLLAHELPQGIAVTSIMLHANFPKRRATIYAALVALATPVGAAGAVLLLHGVSQGVLALLLAVAAGSFLYVAASDLIPETHEAKHAWTGVLLLCGVGFVWLIQRFIGHH